MLRYLALIWDIRDARQGAHAERLALRCSKAPGLWHRVLDRPGLTVFCTCPPAHSDVQVFTDESGVIVGTLFARCRALTTDALCARAQLSPGAMIRIIESRGRELIERYWGNYVAFFCGIDGLSARILRGPASHLPCLHASSEGVQLYFSCMEDCLHLEELKFSIRWMHLARTLFGPCCTEETDICEVREILPGVCEHVDAPMCTRTRLWNPLLLARDSPFEDPDSAARELRAVTRACIQAWASGYRCILHGLSGGLDSSITLAGLASSPTRPRVVCVTQFSEDPDGDERFWARLAAERADCRLIEYPRHADIDFRTALHHVRSETTPGLRLPAIDRIEPDLARTIGAQALCRGEGGDELFFRTQPALAVSDFIRARGLRRGLMSLVMHAAVTEGVTAWQILARGLRDAFFPRRWDLTALLARDMQDATLLHPDVIAHVLTHPTPALPCAQMPRDVPPGRLWQWSLLSARRSFRGPFAREDDPPVIVPLLSQPLIETCLRIPAYMQIADRRDRALARRAFAQDLPPEIVRRRDKGGASTLAAAMLTRNLAFVRSMLLEGLLMRQGMIDRARLEATLSEAPSPHAVTTVPVFNLLGAEIWARAWWESTAMSHQYQSAPTDSSYDGISATPCRLA